MGGALDILGVDKSAVDRVLEEGRCGTLNRRRRLFAV